MEMDGALPSEGHSKVTSIPKEVLAADLDRERMLRLDAESRLRDARLDQDTTKSRLAAVQQDLRQMEEMVRSVVQYKNKVDTLKKEKMDLMIQYENRVQKHKAQIGDLEHDNKLLMLEVKAMESTCSNCATCNRSNNSKISQGVSDADRARLLTEQLRQLEVQNSALVLETEQQRLQYERCLDEIANQVVQTLMSQKTMREECIKLRGRVADLDAENKELKKLLQKVQMAQSSQSSPSHSHKPDTVHIPPSTVPQRPLCVTVTSELAQGTLTSPGHGSVLSLASLRSHYSDSIGEELSSPPSWVQTLSPDGASDHSGPKTTSLQRHMAVQTAAPPGQSCVSTSPAHAPRPLVSATSDVRMRLEPVTSQRSPGGDQLGVSRDQARSPPALAMVTSSQPQASNFRISMRTWPKVVTSQSTHSDYVNISTTRTLAPAHTYTQETVMSQQSPKPAQGGKSVQFSRETEFPADPSTASSLRYPSKQAVITRLHGDVTRGTAGDVSTQSGDVTARAGSLSPGAELLQMSDSLCDKIINGDLDEKAQGRHLLLQRALYDTDSDVSRPVSRDLTMDSAVSLSVLLERDDLLNDTFENEFKPGESRGVTSSRADGESKAATKSLDALNTCDSEKQRQDSADRSKVPVLVNNNYKRVMQDSSDRGRSDSYRKATSCMKRPSSLELVTKERPTASCLTVYSSTSSADTPTPTFSRGRGVTGVSGVTAGGARSHSETSLNRVLVQKEMTERDLELLAKHVTMDTTQTEKKKGFWKSKLLSKRNKTTPAKTKESKPEQPKKRFLQLGSRKSKKAPPPQQQKNSSEAESSPDSALHQSLSSSSSTADPTSPGQPTVRDDGYSSTSVATATDVSVSTTDTTTTSCQRAPAPRAGAATGALISPPCGPRTTPIGRLRRTVSDSHLHIHPSPSPRMRRSDSDLCCARPLPDSLRPRPLKPKVTDKPIRVTDRPPPVAPRPVKLEGRSPPSSKETVTKATSGVSPPENGLRTKGIPVRIQRTPRPARTSAEGAEKDKVNQQLWLTKLSDTDEDKHVLPRGTQQCDATSPDWLVCPPISEPLPPVTQRNRKSGLRKPSQRKPRPTSPTGPPPARLLSANQRLSLPRDQLPANELCSNASSVPASSDTNTHARPTTGSGRHRHVTCDLDSHADQRRVTTPPPPAAPPVTPVHAAGVDLPSPPPLRRQGAPRPASTHSSTDSDDKTTLSLLSGYHGDSNPDLDSLCQQNRHSGLTDTDVLDQQVRASLLDDSVPSSSDSDDHLFDDVIQRLRAKNRGGGKLDVVKCGGSPYRPCVDFKQFFVRYSDPERQAMASFAFLEEFPSSGNPSDDDVITGETHRVGKPRHRAVAQLLDDHRQCTRTSDVTGS